MIGKREAFVKGGFGCLGAFVAVGLLFVLFGGSMHIDIGGAVLLFAIGGLIGLIVLAVYRRGFREGRRRFDPRDRWE